MPASALENRREVAAGVSTGVLVVIIALAHGMMAFAPLGPEAAGFGMAAALASSVIAGICFALLGSTRPIIGTTTTSTALLTASLLAAAQPITAATGMLLAMLATLLAGVIILAVAWARLGRIAALMPTPVTIGVMNATVVLIVLGQLPMLLGLAPGEDLWKGTLHPASLAVAGTAVVLMLRPLPRLPSPVVALGGATAVHYALAMAGMQLGPIVGIAPSPALLADGLRELPKGWAALTEGATLMALIVPAALSLALLSIMEVLSASSAVRERTGRRADISRDLLGGGAAMLGSAAVGGVPGSTLTSATMLCLVMGGRRRLSMLLRAATTLLALVLAGPVIATLPFAALAGVLVGAVLPLCDLRPLLPSRGGDRARRVADGVIILGVVAGAVLFGLGAALAIGVMVSVVLFTASMARSPIRRSMPNPSGRSRVRRPLEREMLLQAEGNRMELIELEGAIFFGSAESIVLQAEQARARGAEILIFDLSRVTRIDISGGRRLLEACSTAPGRVLLAPIHPKSRVWTELEAINLLHALPQGSAMPSLAQAIEAAEELVLASLRGGPPAASPTASEALAALGLPASAVAAILPRMEEIIFPGGTVILRQGEPAEAAFLLLEGEVLISLPATSARPAMRLAVFAPGVMFGESALLGGRSRTADATVRSAARCLRLRSEAAEALRRDEPDAAWHLMAAVARQLSGHVVAANATMDRLES